MAKGGINLPFKVLCCFVFFYVCQYAGGEKVCADTPTYQGILHIHNITLPGNRHVI